MEVAPQRRAVNFRPVVIWLVTWSTIQVLLSLMSGRHEAGEPSFSPAVADALSVDDLWALREDAREMFYHGYDAYMAHGYPWDELKPLSCMGRRWDVRERGTLDDSLGGYALTLVDSLDMLAIIGDYDEFRRAVKLVIRDVNFDKDVVVSVFESTIRVIGGLLSAHLLAADPAYAIIPDYNGELLELAYDLGWRLLPAFNTSTGLPFHRIHLQYGVLPNEQRETCTAAAGTLVLELGLLSKLTNEPVFERLARRALKALWDRRSQLDLLGSNIDVHSGVWKNPFSVIGAGVDSFFEYLLKSYIVLDDPDLLRMFIAAKRAVNDHLNHADLHMETNMNFGYGVSRQPFVSALQAFWPGLEALSGSAVNGTKQIRPLLQLWRRFQALPEMFDIMAMHPVHFAKDAPLRPELAESLYLVYGVTRHPSLLSAGAEILRAINKYSRVKCGYAAIADVITKRLDDRMDSYFLSETTKYLFLLFDASLMPHGHLSLYPNSSAPTESSFPWKHAPQPRKTLCVSEQQSPNATCETNDAGECMLVPTAVPGTQCVVTSDDISNVLTYEAQLACSVRNNRSSIAALPFDPLKALFTTEGHLLQLKTGVLQPHARFSANSTQHRRRRRKAHHNSTLPLVRLSQDTCHLSVEGWEDAFKLEPVHERPISDFELFDGSEECPRWELDVNHTVLDVSATQSLESYLKPSRDSIIMRQAIATTNTRQSQSQSTAGETCPASSDPTRQNKQDQPISDLEVHYNSKSKQFEVGMWTNREVFSSAALVAELNKHADTLASARISGILLNCIGNACNAALQVTQQQPITITVTTEQVVNSDGEPMQWSYRGCHSHFGNSPPVSYAVPPIVAIAMPFHACAPVELMSQQTPEDVASHRPIIAIVGRGQCSFVTKARNVQAAGAIGVIIVDFTANVGAGYAMDPVNFSLANDDTGGDIGITATGISGHVQSEESTDYPGFTLPLPCAIGLRKATCVGVDLAGTNTECSCAASQQLGLLASQLVDPSGLPEIAINPVSIEIIGSGGEEGGANGVAMNNAIGIITTALQLVSTAAEGL